MRITLEIDFDPDMSPVAFITCRAREGKAGRPLVEHRRVLAMEGLEELEEVVAVMVTTPMLLAQSRRPLHLFDEN